MLDIFFTDLYYVVVVIGSVGCHGELSRSRDVYVGWKSAVRFSAV